MKLELHPELRKFLHKIKNEVAELLLEKEGELELENVNYIGRSEDNPNFLSYLSKDRIDKLNEEDISLWERKRRYHTKPSKVIEMIFPGKFNDHEKQKFAVLFRSEATKEIVDAGKVQIVYGDKIKTYYHEAMYAEPRGDSSLHESCMRHPGCQDFFGLYTKNEKHIGLAVILNDEGLVKARCLVWYPKTKYHQDVKYYDRIYAVDYAQATEMQSAMENLGFLNVSDKNPINPSKYDTITITLEYGFSDCQKFPYVDTFRYIEGNQVCNKEYGLSDYEILEETGGGYSNSCETQTCDRCENDYDEEDVYEIEIGPSSGMNLCYECCSHSEFHGERIADRDSVYVAFDNDYVLEEDAVKDYEGRWIIRRNSIRLHNDEYAHENDDKIFTDINGTSFVEGDEDFVEIEMDWYHKDESGIIEINGTWYLEDSEEAQELLAKQEED